MNIWIRRANWDPIRELQREVDRLFDFTVSKGRQFWQGLYQWPTYNLYETSGEYLFIIPMAGVQPDQLEVTTVGNTLVLRGERKRTGEVPAENYRREERWLGRWSRSLPVPEKADLSQVSAALDNGLLVVRMPKLPETQPRKVPIKVQSGA
jgi:HSP20 family protein